jgi:monofunctional biosynthetic peptidoglycan transglycosylase
VSRRWYVPNYKISLESTSSEWKTTTFKLTDLRKHYIGKALNDRLKKETLKDIIRIGFITDQKKYGEFEFELDYIKFK